MRMSTLSLNMKSYNVIHDTSSRYDNLMTQMVSGRKIQKSSENPVLAEKSIYLDNLMKENEVFLRNANDAKSLLNYSESILGESGDRLTRVRALLIQSASDTINNESREAIVKELDQIILEIANMGNQQYNGKYIFAGTNTTVKPFEITGDPVTDIIYTGNNNKVLYNISEDFQMAINVTGSEVFEETLKDLITVRDYVKNGEIDNIGNIGLNLVDKGINQIINARTELGAKSNITDTTMSRLSTMNLELESSYSSLMGVNIVQKQMEATSLEVSYQASLSAISRLHSISILDYLR